MAHHHCAPPPLLQRVCNKKITLRLLPPILFFFSGLLGMSDDAAAADALFDECALRPKLTCDLACELYGVPGDKVVQRLTETVEAIDKIDVLQKICIYLVTEAMVECSAVSLKDIPSYRYGPRVDHARMTHDKLLEPFAQCLRKFCDTVESYDTFMQQQQESGGGGVVPKRGPAAAAAVAKTMFYKNIERKVCHKYSKGRSYSSKPAYGGVTYCKAAGLAAAAATAISMPSEESGVGIFDKNNHAFLVSMTSPSLPQYQGRRITISRMGPVYFALLAMQVASGRTTAAAASAAGGDFPIDPTFKYLVSIFRGETELLEELPVPASLTNAQQCELIFAYVLAYVRSDVSDENKQLGAAVLDYYFHMGAYCSVTKHLGWVQNPRKAGRK